MQSFALETLTHRRPTFNSRALVFFSSLGKRLSDESGDSSETSFLFQPMFVLVQRFDAVLIRESFPDVSVDHENVLISDGRLFHMVADVIQNVLTLTSLLVCRITSFVVSEKLRCRKNCATFIFTVTLANVGRFLKFFQCRNQKEMAHNKNEKFPTVA